MLILALLPSSGLSGSLPPPKGQRAMEEQLRSASRCSTVRWTRAVRWDGTWLHRSPQLRGECLSEGGTEKDTPGLPKAQGRKEMAHSFGSALTCQKYFGVMLQMKSFCLYFLPFLQLCDSKLVHLLTGFTYGFVEVWSPNFWFYLETISNTGSLGKGNESGLNSSVWMCLPNPWFRDSGKHVRVTNG